MASSVEICSAALLLLGDNPIASFSETSPRARACASLYPIAKRAILRAHPWNCTIKRVILAPEASTPAFDWGYQFARPGGWVRTLQVGYDNHPLDYVAEGGRILANTNVLPFVYQEEATESAWDALLTDVMVKRMELDLAYPITKSTSLRDSLKAEFYQQGIGVLARAKAVDGQENPPEGWEDSPFLQVRG
jgi:hypothetical protein